MNVILQDKLLDCCSVCLEPLIDEKHSNLHLREIKCGHVFHKNCLSKWNADGWRRLNTRTNSCPNCRHDTINAVRDIFIDSRNSLQQKNCVHIQAGTTREPVSQIDFFIDQHTLLKDIMVVYHRALGLSIDGADQMHPIPCVVSYEPSFKYSFDIHDNGTTLDSFGIENGGSMVLYHTFKFKTSVK